MPWEATLLELLIPFDVGFDSNGVVLVWFSFCDCAEVSSSFLLSAYSYTHFFCWYAPLRCNVDTDFSVNYKKNTVTTLRSSSWRRSSSWQRSSSWRWSSSWRRSSSWLLSAALHETTVQVVPAVRAQHWYSRATSGRWRRWAIVRLVSGVGPLAYLLAVLMTDSGTCHYRPLQGLGFHQGIPVKLFLSRLVQHSACEFRRQLCQRLTLAASVLRTLFRPT